MKRTYHFSISGMTCHACESLISMDMEDAGLKIKSITHNPGLLTIDIDESAVDRVKQIIEAGDQYTVTGINAGEPTTDSL